MPFEKKFGLTIIIIIIEKIIMEKEKSLTFWFIDKLKNILFLFEIVFVIIKYMLK